MRYYGKWMRDEAEKRVGHLYPKAAITAEMVAGRPDLKPYLGRELTVIAWLWARTVRCPNPGCGVTMPLLSTFILSSKRGKERYLDPFLADGKVRFLVTTHPPATVPDPKSGYKRGMSGKFECAFCGTVTTRDYVAQQATGFGLGSLCTAIVAEGDRERVYLPASSTTLADLPELDLSELEVELAPNPRDVWCRNFGLLTVKDLFTDRQLVALTTLSDLVGEARERIRQDAEAAGRSTDPRGLADDGTGAQAYADAVAVYLGLAVGRQTDRTSSGATWQSSADFVRGTFGRQAIPMIWDFADVNVLSDSTGNFFDNVNWVAEALTTVPADPSGTATQVDARSGVGNNRIVSTDPPYYDNIGYADLSDYFYVWLRRTLRPILPGLFATVAVPKSEELVASPYRHGGKDKAEAFFLDGMTTAMVRLARQSHASVPVTIYYAFKQAERDGDNGTSSTGWETFLNAVHSAGFMVTGTWPMRTERGARTIGLGTNALASSIILVCRPRPADAPTATRGQLGAALKAELPGALKDLQRGNIAPVDLAQAAIGPGMAVFTRYARVLEASGESMTVREALALINQVLDEALAEQEGDFDADSRWALAWFEQVGFDDGQFGVAETLSKAKNTSIEGLEDAGILKSGRGVVRLLRPAELSADWDPEKDRRLTTWESVHQLVRALETGGEQAAAALAAKLGSHAEGARDLCYRLYTLCERKKRAAEALSYNSLVQSWPEIMRLVQETPRDELQGTLI